MIKVMVSDPDLFAREGIKEMLTKHHGFHVVYEAADVTEMLHGLQEARPDVCILELAVAKHAGLGFVRALKNQASNVSLLVMSHCHERDFALRAIRAGASGYLPKDCSAEQLAYALRTAADRRPYVSDTVCDLIVESLVEGRPKRQHDNLSDTDFEIFCLMAEGLPVARIASICKLSVAVVRARRTRIMERMSLRSDAELVEYAIKRKLIGQPYLAF
jgi:DNA-binding NarL/FixJ family response regulator